MKKQDISALLIDWYGDFHRELPWRETTDPYRIWISEVILQQTRVAQGLEYYLRFVGRFADVAALAAAPEDEVLKLWQGLGYYSRARNLHAAAQEVMQNFGGIFPVAYEQIRSLKGVGEYTAAAICSFAYGLPYATVDGNVYRVLSRLFGIDTPVDTPQGRREFAVLAQSLLDTDRAGLHNQAMMEFGALQCVPRSPDCGVCPLRSQCVALRQHRVEALPVKSGRTGVKPRYFNYLHLRCEGQTVLVQRTGRDIWRNLYEFPLIETDAPVELETLQRDPRFREWVGGICDGTELDQDMHEAADAGHSGGQEPFVVTAAEVMPKHQLSHRTIYARFYEIRVTRLPLVHKMPPHGRIVTDDELSDYPIARLTELYLQRRD